MNSPGATEFHNRSANNALIVVKVDDYRAHIYSELRPGLVASVLKDVVYDLEHMSQSDIEAPQIR